MSRATFAKRQREKERQERAAAKAEKRAQRANEPSADASGPSAEEEARLLQELADLHARYEAEQIDFETFSDERDRLTHRLQGG